MSSIIYKKINKIVIFILVLTSIFVLFYSNHKRVVQAGSASSEIVIETNSNRILYEHNSKDKKYMASTTKILTAIVIIENCDLNEIVRVKKQTTGIEGSSIYLEEGEELRVKDLLYGLMLRSGNDCAETLAVHCSGSIEKFAKLMNETAIKIGALNSNFVNPHGLHDDNHYTTAYDLALISSYAIKNASFKDIVSTKSVKIPFSTRNYDRILINKNKMLKEFDGSTGIKTGYTKKAGRCLVTSCLRNGMELVCIVLNCPPMFEQSKQLLTNAFDNYSIYKLLESDNIIDFISDGNQNFAIHLKKDVVLPLTKDEYDNLKIKYNYSKNHSKPLISNQEIGNVEILSKNNLIFKEKIYTI